MPGFSEALQLVQQFPWSSGDQHSDGAVVPQGQLAFLSTVLPKKQNLSKHLQEGLTLQQKNNECMIFPSSNTVYCKFKK